MSFWITTLLSKLFDHCTNCGRLIWHRPGTDVCVKCLRSQYRDDRLDELSGRRCPYDGRHLRALVWGRHTVEQCESCDGVWVSREERQRIMALQDTVQVDSVHDIPFVAGFAAGFTRRGR